MSPLTAIFQALFPTTCVVCGDVLVAGERQLCLRCLSSLDESMAGSQPDNATERLLGARMPLHAAMAFLLFRHGNAVQKVVHAMKFHSGCELCRMMGRQMGLALLQSGRFDDVEALVPVPLHWWRRIRRGYNQSELLCRGIAEVMPRPILADAVVRHRYTRKQSQQHGEARAANVEGAFRVRRADGLEGRHILLVDDVVTTGATLVACADALRAVPGITLSVAAFSTAG